MDACIRAAQAGKFRAVRFDGFWAPMDTLKERAALEEMHRTGKRPWALWEKSGNGDAAHTAARTLHAPANSPRLDYSEAMNFSAMATN
jgi:NDP-sugar pyrophosphorylase family protein